ncbi:carbon-nitrogen hydrolase family protein [Breoghania sp. L-A4]|uniref:carbon-nitrogen hydrolase family protein n=1 Tax=Breoghania sp. L-A4 TaxID=2304600 RepID=UPI000E35ACAC|nr:carbon-nitrogen hydrolase family protein [Breoghania sp. L-A4]AXS42028.1 carbon-nitrogen hydrolase family protein [Breoghania sp. L-A4]
MSAFKAACIQMRSTTSVAENGAAAEALIREAASKGASYVLTPEMTNILVRDRQALLDAIAVEEADPTLALFHKLAAELKIWIHAGSLAILVEGETVANRGFLIGPDGGVRARYDKIHMFDVDLPNGESWRESRTYRPGETAVVTELPWLKLGMAICYDVRFPQIFRTQALAGAQLLTAPAAFTRQTGEAHWHVLQRARAIENGAFQMAAAQGGHHADGRDTYGHSLIVDPWGKVIAEADHDEPCVVLAEIDPAASDAARGRIPVLLNERAFELGDGADVVLSGAAE